MKVIREPVNFYTHAFPAVLAVPAAALLFARSETPAEMISGSVYGACAFILFLISAIYHGFPVTDYWIRFWQKFDHCCIYLMIAGTYTPTSLLVFSGATKWTLFGLIWLIALSGCLLKICNRLTNERISLALYLLMGCMIVPLIHQMLSVLPLAAVVWMLLGGVFYIGGTYFYYKDRPMGKYVHSHGIWHIFVVLGAISHFIYIYFYLFR
ncbi:PAQR family membrane homeostasis protein TrhA [Pararcticibacter amylolyticus]|uniref:Hemolysin III n=1 Tax=Pararcticibacter amylolyticus TaxID=2173175 RepID=A0A2U2PNF5_9SPHI|nr:hemolysin III family protein [Pararcticibacter amylolyticus]PWG82719.1 hemolysin III [Pararcticibacter amylolyticus]